MKSSKQNFFFSLFIWSILLFIAYFGVDIIDKGLVLNNLTPYPILGYVLWTLIVLFIWVFFVFPIIQFLKLRMAKDTSEVARAKFACQYLKKNKRSKQEMELHSNLEFAIFHGNKEEISKLLHNFNSIVPFAKDSRELILRYAKIAAIGVVFNKNVLLDGLILLVLQMRLIVDLAILHGYKPSPVFNTLCFGWVLSNSVVMSLIAQDGSELAGDMVGNLSEEWIETLFDKDQILEFGLDQIIGRLSSSIVSILLESIIAGSTVYVTGRIFLRQLESDSKLLTFKDFIELRKEARKALSKDLSVSVSNKFKDSIKNIVGGKSKEDCCV